MNDEAQPFTQEEADVWPDGPRAYIGSQGWWPYNPPEEDWEEGPAMAEDTE